MQKSIDTKIAKSWVQRQHTKSAQKISAIGYSTMLLSQKSDSGNDHQSTNDHRRQKTRFDKKRRHQMHMFLSKQIQEHLDVMYPTIVEFQPLTPVQWFR
jgi:hypothetical protein